MDKNAFEVMSQRNGPLSVFQALQLTYQILSALKYIHSKNIIHRDIKPENCLVNPYNMELKLGDFGSAKDLNQVTELTEYISTRWYRPPECILSHGSYGPGIDIWATGCILYEFLTNYPLFPGKTSIDQINRIHRILGTPTKQTLSKLCPPNKLKTLDFEFIKYPKQKLSKILPKAEPVVLDLLSKLIAYVPSERITADEALKHPAFNILQQCFFKNPNANYSSAPFAQPNSIPSALFNQEKQLKQTIKDDGNVVKMNITKKKDGIQLPQVDVPIKMTRMQQKRVLMKTPPRKSHVHANNKPGEKMILGRHATGTIAFGEKKNEHPKE
ncbi:CMGC family protein kinase [Histomonas meleagridis]|uniref:CMGC family protein kinase n=1 Tax=Histomonas meleagridis TaxID=135588 RepID=UPI00355A4765|nr:CMGC family protein kinase [Histomonas meleagridis]KAH0800792.1 CMGC family protein kinase [Histomonas meleagridis]